MTEHPRITVLMPVYNGERYLAEAVRSILGQTFGDFEFLIIDDGSTDGSLAILRDFAEGEPRIRIISRPNTGIVGALNEGLALARGELIARMDADDIAVPWRFDRQLAYLDANPGCVLVGSRVTIIDPAGRPLTVMGDALTHDEIVGGFLTNRGQLIYHPAVMFRKGVVVEIGAYRDLFDEAEDLDLFLRLAEVGRVVNLEEPLLRYREHMAKAGKARAVRLDESTRLILEDAHRRRGLEMPDGLFGPVARPFGKGEVFRTWGWWALMAGNVATARRYATSCLARTPLSPASWKLFYCAIRGR